jgi:uncharacterized membrane protein YjgN (DUF898 family)
MVSFFLTTILIFKGSVCEFCIWILNIILTVIHQ